ncbi:MAG TPA: hypothetical protein VLO09_04015, partial [Ornithinimicrobium sp.]|nr:hypothetical protein [Ornithinimicrobium sp.]
MSTAPSTGPPPIGTTRPERRADGRKDTLPVAPRLTNPGRSARPDGVIPRRRTARAARPRAGAA